MHACMQFWLPPASPIHAHIRASRPLADTHTRAHSVEACPAAFAILTAHTFRYQKRFFPFYTFNVLAGVDDEGKGCARPLSLLPPLCIWNLKLRGFLHVEEGHLRSHTAFSFIIRRRCACRRFQQITSGLPDRLAKTMAARSLPVIPLIPDRFSTHQQCPSGCSASWMASTQTPLCMFFAAGRIRGFSCGSAD